MLTRIAIPAVIQTALPEDLRKFLTGASSALIIRLTGAGLAFVSQVFLARWLGMAEFGNYAFAWTWALVLTIVCQLGLATTTTRLVAQYEEQRRAGRIRAMVWFSFLAVILFGVALSLVVALVTFTFFKSADASYFWPLLIALACVPLLAAQEVARGITRGLGKLTAAYVPGFIARPAVALASIAALYLSGITITATLAMVIMFAVIAVLLIYQWSRIAAWLPRVPSTKVNARHWQHWIVISLPVVLIDGQYLMLSYLDIILLQSWVSAEDIALYYAAARTMAVATFVHFAVAAAVTHRLAKLHVTGSDDQIKAAYRRYTAWSFWPTLIALTIILAMGKPILLLFGQGFEDGYNVLVILAVGIAIQGATGPVKYLLTMAGQQNALAATLLVTTAVNVFLNILLIPTWGLAGAAVATSVSLGFACLSMAAVTRYRLGFWPLIGCIHLPKVGVGVANMS